MDTCTLYFVISRFTSDGVCMLLHLLFAASTAHRFGAHLERRASQSYIIMGRKPGVMDPELLKQFVAAAGKWLPFPASLSIALSDFSAG